MPQNKTQSTKIPAKIHTHNPKYSIEYFHVYTDEKIDETHTASLNYLRAAQQAWSVDCDLVVLIDNYNPNQHILSSDDVIEYLHDQGLKPRYWAFEADMVGNAKVLLEKLINKKLKKSYEKYITTHGKYPCSLLTASWYLTRLGRLDGSMVQCTEVGDTFVAAERLISILPEAYKAVEFRAQELILRSEFSESADKIQDLFYPASAHRKIDLF